MDPGSERQYVRACRRGDRAAYRPLVDAYFPRAVRLATAMVGDVEDARDLAQDAFVAAYEALPTFIAGRPFYPWLRGILVNRCRMFLRSRGRARARRAAAADSPGHWAAPSSEGRRESWVGDLVRRALVQLDEDDRTLLVLKHVEGYTYDELAAALSVPAGTVMSRLYRARRRLREALAELDPTILAEAGEEEE
ncbi:MAG: RNA polymerase sigma factor [Acidobacteriota bacterium]